MEAIPVLMLWVCMPLDRTLPPVYAEDLTRFPGSEVSKKEWSQSCDRWHDIKDRYEASGYKSVYLKELLNDAGYACEAWYRLAGCHRARNEAELLIELERLRNHLGIANYYHGQVPAPVILLIYKEARK